MREETSHVTQRHARTSHAGCNMHNPPSSFLSPFLFLFFFLRRLLYSFLPQGEYVNYSIAKRHKQLLTSQRLSYALRNLEENKEGSPRLRISVSCICIACISYIFIYIHNPQHIVLFIHHHALWFTSRGKTTSHKNIT